MSVICSLAPSFEHAMISLPLFVLTVIALIRSLDVGGSAVACGFVRPVGVSCGRVCFDNEPSAMSLGNVCFNAGSADGDADDVLVL